MSLTRRIRHNSSFSEASCHSSTALYCTVGSLLSSPALVKETSVSVNAYANQTPCLTFVMCLSVEQRIHLATSGLQVLFICIPLEMCPDIMKCFETRKKKMLVLKAMHGYKNVSD